MEETSKQKNGFFKKLFPTASAMFSGISQMNMLTTDAVPDKSYNEKKSSQSNGNKPNINVNSPSFSDFESDKCSDSSDDEETKVKNTWSSQKKAFFGTKSKSKKEKRKHTSPKGNGQKNVYYFDNINGLHLGNNYNVIHSVQVNNTQNTNKGKVIIEITQDIRDALSNKESLSTDHIMEVQSHIGNNWLDLGRRLGFTDGQLEQIQSDFSPQRERIYQMLLDWIRSEPEKATVGLLCNCLWEVEEKEAVKKLAEYINKQNKV